MRGWRVADDRKNWDNSRPPFARCKIPTVLCSRTNAFINKSKSPAFGMYSLLSLKSHLFWGHMATVAHIGIQFFSQGASLSSPKHVRWCNYRQISAKAQIIRSHVGIPGEPLVKCYSHSAGGHQLENTLTHMFNSIYADQQRCLNVC